MFPRALNLTRIEEERARVADVKLKKEQALQKLDEEKRSWDVKLVSAFFLLALTSVTQVRLGSNFLRE